MENQNLEKKCELSFIAEDRAGRTVIACRNPDACEYKSERVVAVRPKGIAEGKISCNFDYTSQPLCKKYQR